MKAYYQDDRVKLYNEDCLKFLKNLPSESVDIIITDPAYSGMNNKMNFGNGRIVGKYKDKENGKWFKEFKDDPNTFTQFLLECYRVLRNDRHIYIMFDSFSLLSLASLMREVFQVKNILVWDKINIGMGHYFRRRHELIVFATKGRKKLNTKSMPDIWQIKRITRIEYPTQKPVELFETMIKVSANKNYVVCDPFFGSGSSLIAAIKNNCKFVGSDISEKANETTVKRYKRFKAFGLDSKLKPTKLPATRNMFE